MAGSIKWMVYTSDTGALYAVKHDESNGDLTGFLDFGGATGASNVIPKGFRMRGVNLISQDGKSRRRLEVGDPTNDLFTGESGVITLNGINYQVTSTYGEKAVRPFALDTGLDDGTAG